jgi:3-keto-disaccharide hydrolase
MRRLALLIGSCALIASVAIPASAHNRHHRSTCGKTHHGWTTIFDGSKRCFEKWRYAGGASMTLQRDGTVRSGPGSPGLGVLWYAARPYGDFTLKLQFRDDAPESGARANSGVQVRFPAPHPPVPGCPTTFNGNEQNNAAWIAVNCGHEVQINDSPDGPPFDPRKTGSIYGFADLDSAHSHPTDKGVWNDLEITVVGQHYTVVRNGVTINEFENAPGLPFPGRPNDPGSDSRGLVGYVGLQSHGGANDVVSFRNIKIKDLSDRD